MTFTLIAIDRETGELGVTSASCWPALGGLVPRFRPGVGVVATQNFSNLMMAETMLDELARLPAGDHPGHLGASISSFKPAVRQYGYATFRGHLFGWTGDDCTGIKGHLADDQCVAIGNTLASEDVLSAMVERFTSTRGPLADRLLSALMAGQAMGGDARGPMAACLNIWSPNYPDGDECPIDFRVDLHDAPVQALTEIMTEYRAQPRPMVWRPDPITSDDKKRPRIKPVSE